MRLIVKDTDIDLIKDFTTIDVWKPVCLNVVMEANETIVVNVTANEIDAAIDNVSLEPGKCHCK
jgi:hypothetical protein